jgi:hypothetical protein
MPEPSSSVGVYVDGEVPVDPFAIRQDQDHAA